ncbi:hypothetical protein EVAR_38312_1 [Eumeta japonica]|uniref:Uncharacterized protein n=1 Tax=Eumeta variegata TaxID=151549 RepID=A0A4C1W8G8_EUMVA|nr:hypothetical protein EVAR_38312_1 [Eumeta japonica]
MFSRAFTLAQVKCICIPPQPALLLTLEDRGIGEVCHPFMGHEILSAYCHTLSLWPLGQTMKEPTPLS